MILRGKAIKLEEKILKFGRIDSSDENFKMYYSLTGIEFNFMGKVRLKVTSEEREKVPYLSIVINDEVKIFDIKEETEIIFEEKISSNCKILKRTGINAGIFINLLEIEIEELLPIDDKEYFEVVGDSFSCGYGNLGTGSERYNTYTEDGLQAYSYLLCKAYNMLPTFMCRSGYPVYKSPYAKTNLIDFYDVICEENLSPYIPKKKSKIILFNMGTNDNAFLRNLQTFEEHEEFYHRYLNFLYHMREENPTAPILCASTEKQLAAKEYIARAFQDFQDSNKYYIELKIDGTKKYGSDGHLGLEQHLDWYRAFKDLIDQNHLL